MNILITTRSPNTIQADNLALYLRGRPFFPLSYFGTFFHVELYEYLKKLQTAQM
jgi:hypothetical protein